jgi:hypothetical protein
MCQLISFSYVGVVGYSTIRQGITIIHIWTALGFVDQSLLVQRYCMLSLETAGQYQQLAAYQISSC